MNNCSNGSDGSPVDRLRVTKRLESEGRSEAACIFRENRRRELRLSGVAKQAALEQAWLATVCKFPPLNLRDRELRPIVSLLTIGEKCPAGSETEFAEFWRNGWLAIAKLYCDAVESRRGHAYIALQCERVIAAGGQKPLIDKLQENPRDYLISFASDCTKTADTVVDNGDTADILRSIGREILGLVEVKNRSKLARLIGG